MKLSHSKIECMLTNPAEYYFNYIQNIKPKDKPKSLQIGSAVHWGIEHNTDDLSEYFGTVTYTTNELLATAMVYGYLIHKNELLKSVLENDKYELVEENHELTITSKLKSFEYENHDLLGIIDLLLLVKNKETDETGFIIVDYKTSTYKPDFDKYLEQIYRYIYLVNQEFKDIPVFKTAIINIRKKALKQKTNETNDNFLKRLKTEYDLNEDELVTAYNFSNDNIDKNKMDNYFENLSRVADAVQTMQEREMFFINWTNANGTYGKSVYYPIFEKQDGCELLYTINDLIYNNESESLETSRDCLKIDVLTLDNLNNQNKTTLNHYKDFYNEFINYEGDNFLDFLKSQYVTDDILLAAYINNLEHHIVPE